jgi:hypothetical protein
VKNIRLFVTLATLGIGSQTQAGVYTDDLTKCLVESTSQDDRQTLVKWIFAAMAQHPAVSSMIAVSEGDVDKANAATGALFMRLLTEACTDATKKAIKYEGALAIQSSFGVLGQVATSELFSDQSVQKVLAGLEKYTDQKKIAALKE